jgi:hypothetical protein
MVEIHPTKSGPMIGRVEVKIPSHPTNRGIQRGLNMTLRAYEIPDWQFLRGQFVE